jgi:hypothetical protein
MIESLLAIGAFFAAVFGIITAVICAILGFLVAVVRVLLAPAIVILLIYWLVTTLHIF